VTKVREGTIEEIQSDGKKEDPAGKENYLIDSSTYELLTFRN
jgi:hypothetical protein